MRRAFFYVQIADATDAGLWCSDFEEETEFTVNLYPISGGETPTHKGSMPDPNPALTNAMSLFESAFTGSKCQLFDPYSYSEFITWLTNEGLTLYPVSP